MKRIKKIRRKKISKQRTKRQNPDKYMYTTIKSYILSNKEIQQYMKNRYGPFMAGIIDDMDATYVFELNKGVIRSPEEFFEWYIDNDIDLRNAQYDLKDSDPTVRKIARDLIKHINKIDNK